MPLLSIAENIFLGNEPASMGVIDWSVAFNRTRELPEQGRARGIAEHAHHQSRRRQAAACRDRQGARQEGEAADPRRADRQPERNRQRRVAAICCVEFKAQGITSIIISHKLNELAKVADQITVLRDGATVETIDCRRETISEGRIIKSMVGREMSDRYPLRVPKIGERLFEVENWRVEHPLHAGREVIKGVDLMSTGARSSASPD